MWFSKKKEAFKIGDNSYRLKVWSVRETLKVGKALGFALAPSLAVMADSKFGTQSKEDNLNEIIDGVDTEYLFTQAVMQLSNNFSDDLYEETLDKLLAGLEFRVRGEDGEYGDYEEVAEWSDHFDEYGEDFEAVVIKSGKVNLYDFFIKQPTVRSSIEKVMKFTKPLMKSMQSEEKEASK
jgi:hypothetical protein